MAKSRSQGLADAEKKMEDGYKKPKKRQYPPGWENMTADEKMKYALDLNRAEENNGEEN